MLLKRRTYINWWAGLAELVWTAGQKHGDGQAGGHERVNRTQAGGHQCWQAQANVGKQVLQAGWCLSPKNADAWHCWGRRWSGLIALTMRKMMLLAISGVWMLVGQKTARKRGTISTGAAVLLAAIAAIAEIMGGLKMKVSINVIYLSGRTSRRWLVGVGKRP